MRRASPMSSLVPWGHLIAPGVVLLKEAGALLRTYTVRGVDLAGEMPETQGMRMVQANNALKRLGGQWMLQAEAQRTPVRTYPATAWSHPVAALIDAQRREAILRTPGARETHYYLTLTWTPPLPARQRGAWFAWLGSRETAASPGLAAFVQQADAFVGLLRGVLADLRPLTSEEHLTYLHTAVSDRWHRVCPPQAGIGVDTYLCDSPYDGGGWPQYDAQLGEWHLRACSLTGYPATSFTGMLQGLEALDLDFRWCTRWTGLEQQAALFKTTEKHWLGQEKTLWDYCTEYLFQAPTRVQNTDATNKAQDVDAARQEIGADLVAYGHFTTTVLVWAATAPDADAALRSVQQVIEGRGFNTVRETGSRQTAAWVATHPGNQRDSTRRTPQSSMTVAHLMPGLRALWPGPTTDAYLGGPPWFQAFTDGHSLFRVSNHIHDWGHFLVLGPTRSGKSVLAAFMVAQWLRYQRAQVFWWDVDRSARLLTLLLGGHWYDLAGGHLALQPLRQIDESRERGWALNWLLDMVREAGTPVTGEVQAYLASTLGRLAEQPPSARTLSALLVCMAQQSTDTDRRAKGRADVQGIARADTRLEALVAIQHAVRMALKPYTSAGEYGWLLDADHDDLQDGPIHTFEQRLLLTLPRLVGPVTRYLFHRVEQRFSTETPTLLPMDEAALTWALPAYEDQGKRWMMTTAKKGVSLGFFTHSLSQVFSSSLGPLLLESCPTRFFLPNPAARAPQMADIYARLGVTPEEVTTIASARPQREVYYTCELLGRRLFALPLDRFTLDCLARNTEEDHQRMDELVQREGREGFAAAWMRAHGHPGAARFLEESHDVPTDDAGTMAGLAGVGGVPVSSPPGRSTDPGH